MLIKCDAFAGWPGRLVRLGYAYWATVLSTIIRKFRYDCA
jgi:hypothetical protein